MSSEMFDDFTAELKSYFLNSLKDSVDKYLILFTDSKNSDLNSSLFNELATDFAIWIVDATTNEFIYLAEYLKRSQNTLENADHANLIILESLKKYIQDLAVDFSDREELLEQHWPQRVATREEFYILCNIKNQTYAILASDVMEISSSLKVTSLPQKKNGISGVVAFRGEAIPVVNLADHGIDSENDNIFLFLKKEQKEFCLRVTNTAEMASISEKRFQDLPESILGPKNSLVSRFFTDGDTNVMVLNTSKLFVS